MDGQAVHLISDALKTGMKSMLIMVSGKSGVLNGSYDIGKEQEENADKMSFSSFPENGFTVSIDDASSLSFLMFYGKKLTKDGCPYVMIYDEDGKEVDRFAGDTPNCGNEWKQYYINLALLKGKLTIAFSGGITDEKINTDAFVFSNLAVY